MKAIVLMFDSLNKHMLSAYGCDETITPNFQRLKEKTTRFDNFYVGSMPCMPARRELHTGRYNFLHRSWSPLEPFDDSMPELLKKNGVHCHLVTDHKHYWRDGGATYHSRFSTYDFIRGQEGDSWKGIVKKPKIDYDSGEPDEIKQRKITSRTQHQINVQFMKNEEDHHLARTIESGLDFIKMNHNEDNWFLQLECFDPHEPFFVPEKYLKMYGIKDVSDFDGWPSYYFVTESEKRQATIQKYYKALLTMVDAYVGKVLDYMDEYNLWDDTMLIVNTDHGFLLGEHEWWGKNIMPLYNEIANIPFFIWHPEYPRANDTRQALAQTIDIPPTMLEFFNVEKPADMLGQTLSPAIKDDQKIRDYAIFGYHGCHLNITDGQYVYMRSPVQQDIDELYEYTLMPTRINRRFTPEEFQGAELHPGFNFTKDCSVLKIPASSVMTGNCDRFGHRLYDLKSAPKQDLQIKESDVANRLVSAMKNILSENDSPEELYRRFGFDQNPIEYFGYGTETILDSFELYPNIKFGCLCLLQHLESNNLDDVVTKLLVDIRGFTSKNDLFTFAEKNLPEDQHQAIFYKMALEMRLN
ncbi:sulfatase [Aliivibrio fischeri]|uniref:Sulfatase n=1 Tax=Aliivibrio fischeri SR5 TaxID=1088719 RepID=A0AAV3EPU2_ALIFS|nr:sulfatase [Aliivibrio fischeri]EHN68750.1 sulfatase [Aliivibrio fischeri SR5]